MSGPHLNKQKLQYTDFKASLEMERHMFIINIDDIDFNQFTLLLPTVFLLLVRF